MSCSGGYCSVFDMQKGLSEVLSSRQVCLPSDGLRLGRTAERLAYPTGMWVADTQAGWLLDVSNSSRTQLPIGLW